MKRAILLLIIMSSTFCHAQILMDYYKGPSRQEIANHEFCKDCQFHYAWYQGWERVPDLTKDYTAYLMDVNTMVRSNVHYMEGSSNPAFIVEELTTFQLPKYIENLQRAGFRMIAGNEWVKDGVGGLTLYCGEERIVYGNNYTLTNPGEVMAFFWFGDYLRPLSHDNSTLVENP